MLSKEDFQAWMNDPVTMAVFNELQTVKIHLQNQLANGTTLNRSSVDSTSIETALLVGRIAGLNTLLNMEVV